MGSRAPSWLFPMPCLIACSVEEFHQENNALNGSINDVNIWGVCCHGSLLQSYGAGVESERHKLLCSEKNQVAGKWRLVKEG